MNAESSLKEIRAAISAAKTLAREQKSGSKSDWERSAAANIDLAVFRREIYRVLKQKLASPEVKHGDDFQAWDYLFHSNAGAIKDLLVESISRYDAAQGREAEKLAEAESVLAWLIENYVPLSFGPPKKGERDSRLTEASVHRSRALGLQERFLGGKHPDTLATTLVLANNYLRLTKFEEATPLLEKYVTAVSNIAGQQASSLAPALEMLLGIAQMAGDIEASTKLAARLGKVTGKEPDLANTYFEITPRLLDKTQAGVNEITGSIKLERERVLPAPPSGSGLPNASTTKVAGGSFLGGGIPVIVQVDKDGRIVKADVQIDDAGQKQKIENQISKWRFSPLIYNGRPTSMKGLVYFWIRK